MRVEKLIMNSDSAHWFQSITAECREYPLDGLLNFESIVVDTCLGVCSDYIKMYKNDIKIIDKILHHFVNEDLDVIKPAYVINFLINNINVNEIHNMKNKLKNADFAIVNNTINNLHLDIDISYEEANFLREKLIPEHQLREMALIPIKNELHSMDLAPGELKFESVDQIVIDQINAIESNTFDKKILLEIYNNL